MWNSGFHLLWSHITNLHNENLNYGLKVVPKLTYERISLSPYSVMNVRLAAQVLSDSVGNVLLSFCSPDSHGTAKVCLMMDKFFDCMNVRNTSQHLLKAKPFLKPQRSTDDEKFNQLDQFLEYLRLWKVSIDDRPGNFSQAAHSNLFLLWHTYEGIQISILSLKEVISSLLRNGFS